MGAEEDPKIRDRPIDPQEASLRGQAVEMFARLESVLDSIIAGYYTRRHPLQTYFSLDLLRAEGFSYSLRRDVFEAIVRRHNWYDDSRMQSLRKVGRWRNFLVHVAGVEMHDYTDGPDNIKIGYRDSRPPYKALTVAEAFERFKAEWEKADDYAMEVLGKCFPTGPFSVSGHVVEEPIPPGGFLEDSFKPDWDPFGFRKNDGPPKGNEPPK